jgi:hypothetical protein
MSGFGKAGKFCEKKDISNVARNNKNQRFSISQNSCFAKFALLTSKHFPHYVKE